MRLNKNQLESYTDEGILHAQSMAQEILASRRLIEAARILDKHLPLDVVGATSFHHSIAEYDRQMEVVQKPEV